MLRILILFLSFQVHATQAGCEKALLPNGMAAYRDAWEGALTTNFQRTEPLSAAEYEALMDINVGMVLTAQFENGEAMLNYQGEENFDVIAFALQKHRIVASRYTPQQADDLRNLVFKPACRALALPDCEAYDVPDASERPFSELQELALKWATYHMLPTKKMFVMLTTHAREQNFNFGQIWWDTEALRQQHARAMLHDVFSPEQASTLYAEFVGPFINANFEARLNRELRKTLH